ncbi:MAG: hypothetical protein KAU36_10285, partial [candidate division Zixibacteria bacterium]|nr:hypothetical protein [candidate division Zixibacteria bacterium]
TADPAKKKKVLTIDGDDAQAVIQRCIAQYYLYTQALGVEPPVVVYLSLFKVKGYHLYQSEAWVSSGIPSEHGQFDRDTYLYPGVVIDDLAKPSDDIVSKILQMFWQSSGLKNAPPRASSAQ